MATREKTSLVHHHTLGWVVGGASAVMVGTLCYFTAQQRPALLSTPRQRRLLLTAAAFLYTTGIACIVAGLSLYPHEREELANDIPSLIQQVRNENAAPDLHEGAILASLSGAAVLAGAAWSAWQRHRLKRWDLAGVAAFAAGWIGLAFAASVERTSATQIDELRVAWTLPGVLCVILGSLMFPRQEQAGWVSGPAWPFLFLGFSLYTVGATLVRAPTPFDAS